MYSEQAYAAVRTALAAFGRRVFRTTVIGILVIGILTALATRCAGEDREMDWKPVYVSVVGGGADIWTTYRFLNNGSGCVEGNPILGPSPSVRQMVALKAPAIGLTVLASWMATQPKAPRWLKGAARGVGYAGGGVWAASAVRNVRVCGF